VGPLWTQSSIYDLKVPRRYRPSEMLSKLTDEDGQY
jgi:hypothetical protein